MLMADGNLGTYKDLQNETEGLGFGGSNFIGNRIYENYGDSRKVSVPEQRAKLMGMVEQAMANNDLEMKYKLMKIVASINCHYRYASSTQYTDPQKFVKIFDELIKYHHRDSIFEGVEQEIGKPFRDRNDYVFS
jgi:hypothetical protein